MAFCQTSHGSIMKRTSNMIILTFSILFILQVQAFTSTQYQKDLNPKFENKRLQDKLNTTVNYQDENRWYMYNYGIAFFRGFETTTFAQNATQCYESWVSFYYVEMQQLEIAYHYADTDDAIFNTTQLVGKVGEHMQLCTAFVQGFYNFYYKQKDSYPDAASFFISFFQNILANILNINTIYQAMEADISKTNNMTDVCYQAGKIARIVFDITPVVSAEEWEVDYEEDEEEEEEGDKKWDKWYPHRDNQTNMDRYYLQVSDGAQQMLSFDGFLNFTIGILNGSSLTTQTELLWQCRDTIHSKWYYGYILSINHALSSNYFGVAYQAFSMLSSIDPIARNCFGGVEKSVWQYYNWTTNSTSVETIFTNFGLNLGDVLRSVKDIVLYFLDSNYASDISSPAEAGSGFGAILKAFFISPPLKSEQEYNPDNCFWCDGYVH